MATDAEKEVEYHRAGHTQREGGKWRKPRWVPSRVRVFKTVTGDIPYSGTRVHPGEYDCECNGFGAVSVKANDNSQLGLRLDEFEPIAWRDNPDCRQQDEDQKIDAWEAGCQVAKSGGFESECPFAVGDWRRSHWMSGFNQESGMLDGPDGIHDRDVSDFVYRKNK